MTTVKRIECADYFRGLALLVIFIDHVPGNPVSYLTLRNWGFSDATEPFIFMSGLVLAYVYWPRFVAGKTRLFILRCLRRASQIYGAQLATCASVLLIFGLGYFATRQTNLLTNDAVGEFFAHPVVGAIGLVSLGFQFGYVNILPVYVVLLLIAPVMMAILRHRIWLGLSVSAAGYAAARLGLQLPSWPWPNSWFLDPFAWQFLFTLGLVAGIHLHGASKLPRTLLATAASSTIVVVAFFVRMNGFGLAPHLSDQTGALFDANKQFLGLGLIAHFVAIAYLAIRYDVGPRLIKLVGAQEICRLGRNGLTIFTAGSILSALGRLTLDLCRNVLNATAFGLVGILIVVTGTVVLVAIARFAEWRTTRRAPRLQAIAKAEAAEEPHDDLRLRRYEGRHRQPEPSACACLAGPTPYNRRN